MAITVFLVLFWVIFWIGVLVVAAVLLLGLLVPMDTFLLKAVFLGAVFLCGSLGGLALVYAVREQFIAVGVTLATPVVFAALFVAWEVVIKPRLKRNKSS
jgi:hypothetical protein